MTIRSASKRFQLIQRIQHIFLKFNTNIIFDLLMCYFFLAPYGIRESTEKIGIERQNYSLSPEHLVNHIPSKIDYNLPEIFEDLLNFAALHLCIGKKLVFWYPCYR